MEEIMNGMGTTVDEMQYIVVKLGDEKYGLDISYIDNIVRMQRMTRVPKSQTYFVGVINLRGEVVPIMSLRKRFGLEEDIYGTATRIIIIRLEDQSMIGLIVDEVQDSDRSQLEFLEALKEPETKIFAVGDPNQVIYSFRGTTQNMFFLLY